MKVIVGPILFWTRMSEYVQKQLKHSSKYLILYSTADRNAYRFGTTCGWVNGHFWMNYSFLFNIRLILIRFYIEY